METWQLLAIIYASLFVFVAVLGIICDAIAKKYFKLYERSLELEGKLHDMEFFMIFDPESAFDEDLVREASKLIAGRDKKYEALLIDNEFYKADILVLQKYIDLYSKKDKKIPRDLHMRTERGDKAYHKILTDISTFEAFEKIYKKFFSKNTPKNTEKSIDNNNPPMV